jgi:hypothetical protein
VPIGIPNQHIDPADLTRKKILIVLPIITARTNVILEVVKAAESLTIILRPTIFDISLITE